MTKKSHHPSPFALRPLLGAGILWSVSGFVLAQDAPEGDAGNDGFASPQEKRSYAIGMFFAERVKSGKKEGKEIDAEAVVAGLKEILGGGKGFDYATGVAMAQNLLRDEIEVDASAVAQAVSDVLAGNETRLDEATSRSELNALQQELQKRKAAEREKQQREWEAKLAEEGPKNKEAGEKFLAENKKNEGVQVTDSGLQYQVHEPGEGESPKANDRVSVIYQGRLLDGTVFDDSNGQTREFGVNRVIKGWTEGLQLMKKGAKYTFWIPGDLAYGMKPRMGGKIGAMDTLIFDVELADIKAAPKAATPPVSVSPRKRKPITAVTPPVAIDIPPRKSKEGTAKEGEKENGKAESGEDNPKAGE